MSTVPHADARDSERRLRSLRVGAARLVYWLPVLAALVIFAQVALLGLRPALSERTRLKQAELLLEERYQRDTRLNQQIAAHLAARSDPVFLERQRRSRQLATALSR